MDDKALIATYTFIGLGSSLTEAIERARNSMLDWYATQGLRFWSDGHSIFQFSTASYVDSTEHTFIITVFDTRPPKNRAN